MQSLLSPRSLKYLGSRTSEKVKNKILELLYSWTVGLPEEVKIAEAYQMLKKQGEAPELGVTAPSALPWGFSSFRTLAARSWVCLLTAQDHRVNGASLWLCLRPDGLERRWVCVSLPLREWSPIEWSQNRGS